LQELGCPSHESCLPPIAHFDKKKVLNKKSYNKKALKKKASKKSKYDSDSDYDRKRAIKKFGKKRRPKVRSRRHVASAVTCSVS
jgi:hypothetical protein